MAVPMEKGGEMETLASRASMKDLIVRHPPEIQRFLNKCVTVCFGNLRRTDQTTHWIVTLDDISSRSKTCSVSPLKERGDGKGD